MTYEYRLESFIGVTHDLVNLLNTTWAPQGYRLHTIVARTPNSMGGYDIEAILEREE